MRIFTLPGVFQPHSDCRLLATTMRERGVAPGATVLDGAGAAEHRRPGGTLLLVQSSLQGSERRTSP